MALRGNGKGAVEQRVGEADSGRKLVTRSGIFFHQRDRVQAGGGGGKLVRLEVRIELAEVFRLFGQQKRPALAAYEEAIEAQVVGHIRGGQLERDFLVEKVDEAAGAVEPAVLAAQADE